MLECTYGNPKDAAPACHLGVLLDALVTSVGVNHLYFAVQGIRCWGQVVHIGGGGFHRADQTCVFVNADVDFHPVGEAFRAAVIPLVALLCLMHLRIPLPLVILVPPAHSGSALVKVELGAAIAVGTALLLMALDPPHPRWLALGLRVVGSWIAASGLLMLGWLSRQPL